MGIEWRYKSAFRKAVRLVERFYPDYAIIGRFARNFYAPPETTLDIDFLVDLGDYERLAELIEYASSQYRVTPGDVGHWQYTVIVSGVKVDLVHPPLVQADPGGGLEEEVSEDRGGGEGLRGLTRGPGSALRGLLQAKGGEGRRQGQGRHSLL